MLRNELSETLKTALKARQSRRVATVRLILAAIKDRDIAIRSDGRQDGVTDDEILGILQKMIKQRKESIGHYEQGGRMELVEQESQEIDIIREFLPEQISGEALKKAALEAIGELGAESLKDMGPTMALLKDRFAGRMDFSDASAIVKQILSS